jgi:surface antigen
MVRYVKPMKQKPTTRRFRSLTARTVLVASAAYLVLASPLSVFADRFDDAINGIEGQISSYEQQAAELRARGDTLQNTLDAMTAEKNALQAQIDLNQAKFDKLTADITANEEKLDRQKRTLNKTVAQIYANSDTPAIVVLASARNVGEYVSAQDVRNSVRDQMKSAMDQVKKLKAELVTQKTEVEQVLNDQNQQKQVLAAKEAEQSKLVADTRGEEAAYQNLIATKNSEISSLRDQQAAANLAAATTYDVSGLVAGAGCGGYPALWCNAAQDTLVDKWGMYNRECVSYTAWKVAASGRYMPYWGGRGNANEWPSSAAADNIPTGSEPRVGSVAIMYVGWYGHAMYVERLNSNGTIHVSQFNWGIRGEYTEMDVNPSGLTFIYF